MDEPAPAPCSTRISSPAACSLPSASGTRATRRSPGAVSLATPTFMGTTLTCVAGDRGRGGPRGHVRSREVYRAAAKVATPSRGCGSDRDPPDRRSGGPIGRPTRTMSIAASPSSPTTSPSCGIGAVPAHVVAGPELDDVVALASAGSGRAGRGDARRRRGLCRPTRPPAPAAVTSRIEMSRRRAPSTCSTRPRSDSRDRPLGGPDDDGAWRLAHEEPGDRARPGPRRATRGSSSDGDALSFSICDR